MKLKNLFFLLVSIGFLFLTVSAHASLITSEDFEAGATGWSNNTTTYGGSTFTNFLGQFDKYSGVIDKNYTLSGNQTAVTVSFDFYEIDSWDYEYFTFSINSSPVFSDQFKHNREDFSSPSGAQNAQSLIFPGDNGDINYGFANWPDQGYHYEYTFNYAGTALNIAFSSNLSSPSWDESYGIDNVVITDNYEPNNGQSTIPEPATMMLFGIGLLGLAGVSRRKK